MAKNLKSIEPLLTAFEKEFFDFAKRIQSTSNAYDDLFVEFFGKLSIEVVKSAKVGNKIGKCRDFRCLAFVLTEMNREVSYSSSLFST